MSEQVNSQYYESFPETLKKYDIPEGAIPYVGESMQGVEEMFFGFTMFLIQ